MALAWAIHKALFTYITFAVCLQAVNCLLRWLRKRDDSKHGLISGFLAGLSIWFYKGPTIPLYAATKLAEVSGKTGLVGRIIYYVNCRALDKREYLVIITDNFYQFCIKTCDPSS